MAKGVVVGLPRQLELNAAIQNFSLHPTTMMGKTAEHAQVPSEMQNFWEGQQTKRDLELE